MVSGVRFPDKPPKQEMCISINLKYTSFIFKIFYVYFNSVFVLGIFLKALYNVTLEYDVVNEFFLTDKIDAKFFWRSSNEKSDA